MPPYFGSQSLSEIHGIEMQKFINSLQKGKKPLSSKSIRNTYNILNAMFSKALALHLIQENPCSTVSLPKKDSKPRSALNREEVARYLECAEGTDLALIFILEFSLGLRLGELCGLRWQDIDLDKGTVHICNTRINAGGKVIEKGPKTAAGNRTIVLGYQADIETPPLQRDILWSVRDCEIRWDALQPQQYYPEGQTVSKEARLASRFRS